MGKFGKLVLFDRPLYLNSITGHPGAVLVDLYQKGQNYFVDIKFIRDRTRISVTNPSSIVLGLPKTCSGVNGCLEDQATRSAALFPDRCQAMTPCVQPVKMECLEIQMLYL